jgi:NAD(P)H-dependent FMN reductase
MEYQPMTEPINLILIYGSTREGRFCDVVAGWAAAEIGRHPGFSLRLVDPAALALPSRHERVQNAALGALGEELTAADAFVVVTPEYNHGYPAALKFLIDSFSRPWRAKPVGFVSYGGISGGLRAIEQLRLVFAEVHAVAIRDSVSFANARTRFDPDGGLLEPEAPAQAMATMLGQLQWWALALRAGRAARTYGEAAA